MLRLIFLILKKGVSQYELCQSIIGYGKFNTLIDSICDCRDITRKEIAMQEKEKRRQEYLKLKKEFEGEEL